MSKCDIKDYTLEALKKLMLRHGQPGYRAEQIFYWLYQKGVSDFNKMSNISQTLRDSLAKSCYIGELYLHEHLTSPEGVEKFLFKLNDGNFVETVLIPSRQRKTVCLSSQVGCKFCCRFCASGSRGFIRNLSASEILSQVLFLQHNLKREISNYVFMGIGEPLDNFKNVKLALAIMNQAKGMNIGARRITISTCGVVPAIRKLARLGLQVNLSISLHACNDRLRDYLMPINKRYPLDALIRSCQDYINETGRMITFEYVLIKGVNDSPSDVAGLAQIAKSLRAKVNLLSFSEIPKQAFKSPRRWDLEGFIKVLEKKGVKVTLRQSKGSDIQAACGQLAGRKRE